ncbi:MAG: thiopurine S-methyltransferase [Gammaproteobacteria bacterium]|nr:thiopurine S-methyltransferase [Gammaproteobacteria bacterium]
MEAQFWLDKWACNQIGFHADAPHPRLVAHFDALAVGKGARVFVPLCGKSHDMRWLADTGCEVLGVELADLALRDFIAEQRLVAVREPGASLACYRAAGYTLYSGDFFALDGDTLGAVDAIYDRAALIALAPAQRAAYAARLAQLSRCGTRLLLITVDYDQNVVSPPPFVIARDELETLFGRDWAISHLATVTAEVKGEPGSETVYILERR